MKPELPPLREKPRDQSTSDWLRDWGRACYRAGLLRAAEIAFYELDEADNGYVARTAIRAEAEALK